MYGSSKLSDNLLISIDVSLQKQSISDKVISCGKYKLINKDTFLADLHVSSLVLDQPDDMDNMVELYDSTLRYNVAAKSNRRYYERLWIRNAL